MKKGIKAIKREKINCLVTVTPVTESRQAKSDPNVQTNLTQEKLLSLK